MALNNMGNIIYRKGDFERALEHYSQSLRMQRFIYKEAINSNLAHTINNIGACYQELGDSDKAIEYYTQSLEMRRIVYQDIVKYHSEIADSLANLGKIYRQIGEIAKSNECYQECHQIRKHIEGFPSKEVAIALANIAINFKESKDILKAMIHIHKAWREILQIKNNEGKKFVLVSLEEIAKEFSMHFKLDPEIITKMVITFGFQNKDIENSELHFLKAISSYESNNIMEAINSYELSLIFITEENAHAKITIYHNLACMYQAVSLTEREKQNVDLANEYYVRAIFCFEKAIEISGANIKQGLSVEYANFLIGNKRSSEAVDYLLNAISGENDGSGLCYGLLEKESVAEILKNKIELTGKSIYIVPKEYAYYLLMHYYKELSSVAELKPQAEYLQEFKSIINSTLGYYLYGQIIQEKGLENDVFLSTGDGLKFLSIAEKELSEEGFKKLFEFCSSKHIEDSVLSESDIQEIGALFNLFLDSQEDLNYDSKVSASQGNELLKTIDKIKDFVGEKELSNLPGFYQYIFNALSNNHFSKSATQVLDIARNLISSLEKLIDISLYIQDEEIEENGDIGTSLWTQLEGLLEFTGSGQRFIGSPKPPYFDPGDDDHGGGSSSFSSSAGRGSENENITESIVISLNGTVLSNNTFENDI
jgi:tetratricopeptide (TPR) repeat protein